MFARFDENPAMTLQDIKKKKTIRTDGRTHTRTDNVKTVYPPQTKFAGVIKTKFAGGIINSILHEHLCKNLYLSHRQPVKARLSLSIHAILLGLQYLLIQRMV